ncbi:hypothetical protein CFOL_v3_28529 [Cephalotus follicularis]|uniref:Membrane-associated kinase regulator 2 n=1 Tax=Cephalotus follicularis TaxID=3775 RepID=A0A1Q3CXW8_CEPFO|nr:hypothetical protein CFOL_v3_28529 [Cephalotus follicularis]
MEAFSLLKYWRGGGLATSASGDNGGANSCTRNEPTTKIVTAIANHELETDDDDDHDHDDDDENDDGPFFDLEFTVPDDDDEDNKNNEANNDDVLSSSSGGDNDDDDDDCTDGDERGFKFTLSSNSSNDRTDPNLTLSPSDDLFFKGRLVPIEPSFNNSEPNSKPQFPVSFLKSATKFRVFMLGFKKPKLNASEKTTEINASVSAPSQQQKQPKDITEDTNNNSNDNNNTKEGRKFFTVNFKVEEVPIVSLFTRDNSSRTSTSVNNNNKAQKQNINSSGDSVSTPDDKKFTKDVMQKYLNKVKPLYVRVSKRYGDKLRFSGQLGLPLSAKSTAEKGQPEPETAEATAVISNGKGIKQGNIPAGLRVVCKHLGKSRSASSAVAPSRRDDSLLEQQDSIQSAILHCKRSFNASRDCESTTLLPRSVSDPSRDKTN